MSILNWFNKPKWQSNNEQVRLAAVQHSTDANLRAHLAEIVFKDSSTKIQKAALSRINDLSVLQQVVKEHPNTDMRHLADKKISQSLALVEEGGQTQTHLQAAKQLYSNEAKIHLIEQGQSLLLQQAAVDGLSRQGLLGDLLLSINNSNLQQHILTKINQPSTLNRIKTRLGDQNNVLKNAIEDKLQQQNPEIPEETAHNLCKQLEEVVLKKQSIDLELIEQQWHQLPQDKLPKNLKVRYQGALNTAKMTLDSDYRDAFLQQQKQQRQQQSLSQLKSQLDNAEQLSLAQLQQVANQYQSADIDLLDTAQQAQWQQLLETLNNHLNSAQQAAQVPSACHDILNELENSLKKTTVQPQKITQLNKKWQHATANASDTADMAVLQQQFTSDMARLADKITASAERRDQAAQQAITLLEPIAEKIKDGQLSDAKNQINQLNNLQKEAGFNHPTIKKHKFAIDQLWQQLKELRQWQQWSHDKVRQEIIEDLNKTIGSGMHPDAVLQKLQQANQQWSDLEDMEKLPGDRYSPRNQKQWQAFRAVSQALFEPAQPFFEKRSEQQSDYLSTIEQHINTMRQVDLEETAPPDLTQLVKTAVKYLKNLDKLSPKDRGKSAKSLRHEMNRINNHLTVGYKKAETNKQQLIEQAQALIDVEDLHEAIEAAKQLQKQWPKAGYVSPKTERNLWKKFRRANDRVFNRREAQQKAKQAEMTAHNKESQQLIKSIRAELKQCQDLASLDQLHTRFNSEWQQLAQKGHLANTERQSMLENFDQQRQHIMSHTIVKEINQWQNIDKLYSQFENGELTAAALDQALSEFPQAAREPFAKRQEQETQTDALLDLLIAGEYLTGLETPKQYLDQRMAYQVNVLADRMSGADSNKTVYDQAQNWLQQWYQQAKADDGFMKKSHKRITKVCKAVTDLAVNR
ncbi:DUF349 domain-containing protein [Marinicella gelatinilytica]|uniref:DUF349 domain-containing protein n=1 Tax=Marinicella gelatinilytica TaxID=2996017 RepID=UPI002260BC75|nr:DUF349 domain-containing protein [Marinicella gelatinilytica]MCX7544613.1 DUF349 domain-containing protein [Marinicella gelatinilytica]